MRQLHLQPASLVLLITKLVKAFKSNSFHSGLFIEAIRAQPHASSPLGKAVYARNLKSVKAECQHERCFSKASIHSHSTKAKSDMTFHIDKFCVTSVIILTVVVNGLCFFETKRIKLNLLFPIQLPLRKREVLPTSQHYAHVAPAPGISES